MARSSGSTRDGDVVARATGCDDGEAHGQPLNGLNCRFVSSNHSARRCGWKPPRANKSAFQLSRQPGQYVLAQVPRLLYSSCQCYGSVSRV